MHEETSRGFDGHWQHKITIMICAVFYTSLFYRINAQSLHVSSDMNLVGCGSLLISIRECSMNYGPISMGSFQCFTKLLRFSYLHPHTL